MGKARKSIISSRKRLKSNVPPSSQAGRRKMKIAHMIAGSLFTISLISWGVLLWYHFPDTSIFSFIAPAILCFAIGVVIELLNY